MMVMRAGMKMTVKMELGVALRVATIWDASTFSNGVASSFCAELFLFLLLFLSLFLLTNSC